MRDYYRNGTTLMSFDFTKMHGLGNDFIVINALQQEFSLSAAEISQLAHRRTGIGFDQLLVVASPDESGVDFSYRIFNADGGEVENCGNGARCFARYVTDRGLTDKKDITVSTSAGQMILTVLDDNQVLVRMDVPVFEPDKVPFVAPDPASHYDLSVDGELLEVGVVSIGNPHAVTVVRDVQRAEVLKYGPLIENHERFPQRVNAGFMQIDSRSEISLRVFERGVGETMACGTGACAAVAVGVTQGVLDRQVTVHLAGGDLVIRWMDNDARIEMIGPVETVFEGRLG